MSSTKKPHDPFFPSIGDAVERTDHPSRNLENASPNANEQDEHPVQELDSLCMACGEQGRTRMLLTSIPYFKEVIIMSFQCDHCGVSNNEVQSAGAVRDHGITYTLKALDRDDLDRQLVKSPSCSITIPEYQLTIPPGKGQLTTVEGVLRDTVLDLRSDQPLRKIQDEKTYAAIQSLIDPLAEIIADTDSEGERLSDATRQKNRRARLEKPIRPFTLILDDPSGDSFLEFKDSMSDARWTMRQYNRTLEQNQQLGLASADTSGSPSDDLASGPVEPNQSVDEAEGTSLTANEEIFVFPGVCSSCGRALNTMMKKVVIPYFKDIIIMSTNCNACGYRDNEVKSSGAVSDQGKKITLKVEDSDDLARDILKSESCGFEIPEIGLHLQPGTLGGRFTTLEGILTQVYEELSEKVFLGDSSERSAAQLARGETDAVVAAQERNKFSTFLGKLKSIIAVEHPFTVILDDPLANSYLQNLYAPDDDPNMTAEVYERTYDQNEDLGLNDMKVEDYEETNEQEQTTGVTPGSEHS